MIKNITHAHPLIALSLIPLINACNGEQDQQAEDAWLQTNTGAIISLSEGEFKKLRLQVIDEEIFRVTATPQENFHNLPDTLMVVAEPVQSDFSVTEAEGKLIVKTAEISAEISLTDGTVEFKNASGKTLLAEAGRSLAPVTRDPGPVDEDSHSVRQYFRQSPGEAIYGLGQRQDGRVNLAGENIELTTHNMEITIPYLVSSYNYGLLWNNTGISRLGDPRPPQPLAAAFELYDIDGNKGGLTAHYYDGDKLKLARTEADLNYQFLSHGNLREVPLPEELADAENLRIRWSGSIVPKQSGKHEFKMYSSGYATLSLDGDVLLDRWRMNWNPWYHNAKIDMQAGRKYQLDLHWRPQGGYLRLLQYAPRPLKETQQLTLSAETAKAVDYYFVAGDNLDEVISGYRHLTGKATMLPKWAFGFWQSRERYKSQDELISALEEYRARRIPIDNIVLDWSYWPEDAWGSHDFDPQHFPAPGDMVDRVHELNANIMISVWPKFYPSTENYKALNAAGCMFNKNIDEKNIDWIGPGYLNAFYDAYNPECRKIYWRQIRDKLNRLGFDAWWLDAVEPDIHSNLSFQHRKALMTPNAMGTGAEMFNAYALPHAESVYRGERESDGHKRSFILTRSGFGGIQRTGSAIWSGDVVSRWSNLKEQIAAGIGVGMAGMPYWTFDIGGFTPEDRYRYNGDTVVGHFEQMAETEQREWQELNLRWFQFGAFTPLFRSHGQNPFREIYNIADKGSETYHSLVWYTKLRYRLMPYIYTLAGDTYHRDSTIMRGLAMDFGDDPKVLDINTQYLFGPALLINPVYEFGARSRQVYLPAGADWYDFYSGKKHQGGRTLNANAPYSRIPIFVKAGSIIPTGPDIQHTGQSLNAPITLNVFTGADGSFDIYEDDGLSYDYEQGQWSRIPVSYDDASGELTIGDRIGSFKGMEHTRQIHVRWIDEGDSAVDFETKPGQSLKYNGEKITLKKPA
ncbi:glycoside hydrolase family 31 protein [Microbulbifer thermotolerans]|uniref:TIM-barrel domain-containing protein n=1 Tax=Microbulbifer thermotolerans TaxID=252514 RepID=UPI002673E4D9|nr:TIM-barrel domain-containing protein [Microbulbifer thermotolerans]WKT60016.1 glycoside hydrolase family 31 protein [Microbulbifer thermotolerans]